MRAHLRCLAATACLAILPASCISGPHQLRRTIDDWDQKTYVNNPWLNVVLWVVPVMPTVYVLAMAGDFLITDAYAFWLNDAWDGEGTGFDHYVVECVDGTMGSLLLDRAAWLRVEK